MHLNPAIPQQHDEPRRYFAHTGNCHQIVPAFKPRTLKRSRHFRLKPRGEPPERAVLDRIQAFSPYVAGFSAGGRACLYTELAWSGGPGNRTHKIAERRRKAPPPGEIRRVRATEAAVGPLFRPPG